MKWTLLLGLVTGTAAWMIIRNPNSSTKKIVTAEEAAAKLREVWADRHAA